MKYEVKKGKDNKFSITLINQNRMGTKKVPWKCIASGLTESECTTKQKKIDGLMKTLNQKQSVKPASGKITLSPDTSKKQAENRAKEYIAKKIGLL